MDCELIVVWDGTHRNQDHDLLCCPLRLPERVNVQLAKDEHLPNDVYRKLRHEAIDIAEQGITGLLRTWRTTSELKARLDLPEKDLKRALRRLARAGRLESVMLPLSERTHRCPQMRHRLKAQGRLFSV